MTESVKISVQVKQISSNSCEATARDHTVVMDRPQAKGGEDRGAMGGEVLLMSLGGCFMSNLLAAIRAREAAVNNIRLALSGTLAQSPARYTDIEVSVAADCEDQALLSKLVTIADRGCIVSNTLRNAVKLSFQIE